LFIRNKELNIMAYDASASALALSFKGVSVLPQPGVYPLAPSANPDISILANRALDDFTIGDGSEIRVTAPGSGGALIAKAPATVPGCPHYRIHFANSQIVVKQPAAVYGLGNAVLTETHEYKRSADYPNQWGNIGCPNCGTLYAGNLAAKTVRPVGSFEEVTFTAQTGSKQWYRCFSVSGACATKAEWTATLDRRSDSVSCIGKENCYAWRFSTDGDDATDTFQLKFKEKICVRYCSR
jgi:hypothetical protein